jgi:hypothetical protein
MRFAAAKELSSCGQSHIAGDQMHDLWYDIVGCPAGLTIILRSKQRQLPEKFKCRMQKLGCLLTCSYVLAAAASQRPASSTRHHELPAATAAAA